MVTTPKSDEWFQDKTALVAGGASGIGAAISRLAVEQGARVIIADFNISAAQELASTLSGAISYPLDVADPVSVEALLSEFGAPDMLFNSAAMWEMASILETTRASFHKLFSVNVEGLFFLMQAVANRMVTAGKRGAIVNIASQAGRRGEADSAIYAATKAAVISLTQSAALGLIDQGIRVNAVAPGNIDTPMWHKIDEVYAKRDNLQPGEKISEVCATIPYGRFAHPDEVAQVALFLASSKSEYVIGQTWNVDGGNILG